MQFAQNPVDVLQHSYHPIMRAEVIDGVRLPYEILEQIISSVWLSLMHPKERKHFVVSVSLVSKFWLALFTRIRARDAFMVSSSLERCRTLISTFYHSKNLLFPYPHSICRTFTCQIILSTPKPSRAHAQPGPTRFPSNIYGKYNRDLLATFRLLPFLPNLLTLSVIYVTEKGLLSLPRPQRTPSFDVPVVCMGLEYIITAETPPWVVDELGLSPRANARWAKQRHVPWAVPDLEHVSFADDMDDTAVGAFLNTCQHLQLACDERFTIKVKIMSASRYIPQHAVIVHGAMEPSSISTFSRDGCYPLRHDRIDLPGMSSAGVVRGMALGFLFGNMPARGRASMEQEDVSHNWRAVHVFMSRSPG